MNKKLIGLGLGIMLSLGMIGCNNDDVAVEKVEENSPIVEQKIEDDKSKNKEMNAVLMDNEYVKATIIEKYEDEWGEIGYKIQVENKTDKHLIIYTNNTSVDGMMNDPLFYVELTGNKKANENMYWYKDSEENGNVKSIDDLKNIETTFIISDGDTYNTLKEETYCIE